MAKVTGRRGYSAQPKKVSGVVIPIFQGLLASFVVSIISIVFLSFLTLSSESTLLENYLQYVIVAVTMGSIFIGSAFATKRVESRALIIGMAVGCIYVLFSVGIGMELANESISWLVLANKFIAGLAAGALGGIVGVNL